MGEQPGTAARPAARPRILHVLGSLGPDQGGLTTAVAGLVEALLKRGVSTRICASDRGGRLITTDTNPVNAVTNYVDHQSHLYFAKFTRALTSEMRGTDVVHVHGIYSPEVVAAIVLATLYRKPYVVQPHGMLETYDRQRGSRLKRFYLLLLGRLLGTRPRLVLATSDNERREIEQTIRVRCPVSVVGLGVAVPSPRDASELAADPELARWLDVQRPLRFLFLSRYAQKKRPDVVIDAWASIPDTGNAHLLMVGSDGTFTRAELQRRCAERGVDASVTVCGPRVGRDRDTVFAHAGVYVLPSERENYGLTIAEALVAGCSVITTAAADASRFVRSFDAGSVVRDESAELLRAPLLDRIAHPDVVQVEGRKAGQRRAELFWDGVIEAYMRSYGSASGICNNS